MPVEKDKVNRFKYWVIGMVNGIEAKDLVDMIKNNDVPIPFDLELPTYFSWVRDAAIEYKQVILEQLTFESAMKYSGEFRPDLKVILQHPKGREWLERFLKVIRFMITNIELTPHEMKVKFFQRAQAIQQKRNNEAAAYAATQNELIKIEQAEKTMIATQAEKEKIKKEEQRQLNLINSMPNIKTEPIIAKRERKPLYENSPYDVY